MIDIAKVKWKPLTTERLLSIIRGLPKDIDPVDEHVDEYDGTPVSELDGVTRLDLGGRVLLFLSQRTTDWSNYIESKTSGDGGNSPASKGTRRTRSRKSSATKSS